LRASSSAVVNEVVIPKVGIEDLKPAPTLKAFAEPFKEFVKSRHSN
jgi:hypothetical protein